MAKTEESWYQTGLDLAQIKQVFNQVLVRAEISPLNFGPLDESAAFGILADQRHAPFKKPKFGNGLASAQILVHEKGDHRRVQFIALGTSAGAQLGGAWQVRNESMGSRMAAAGELPVFKSSKNMVAALVSALQQVDPQLKRVG